MKIAIASLGRFHVFELAKQLHLLGHEVQFISYVPKSRLIRLGLPHKCITSLTIPMCLFLFWQEYFPLFFANQREKLLLKFLNLLATFFLKNCDILIFMSGAYLETAKAAKKKYGSKLFIERGSKHILTQSKILSNFKNVIKPSKFIINRELSGYLLADKIVIPSLHVKDSFIKEESNLINKLFINPYGVDLNNFIYSKKNYIEFDAIFVGTWSYRKGSDLFIELLNRMPELKLTHVGKILDYDIEINHERLKHYDSVHEAQLKFFYKKANFFIIPSREEGLAMVQAQALASGLILICSNHSGGVDLGHTKNLKNRIFVFDPHNVDQLEIVLRNAFNSAQNIKNLTKSDLEALSWYSYGKRYNQELLNHI